MKRYNTRHKLPFSEISFIWSEADLLHFKITPFLVFRQAYIYISLVIFICYLSLSFSNFAKWNNLICGGFLLYINKARHLTYLFTPGSEPSGGDRRVTPSADGGKSSSVLYPSLFFKSCLYSNWFIRLRRETESQIKISKSMEAKFASRMNSWLLTT